MIDRRHLLILLGAAAVAPWKLLAQARQPVVIGWLHATSRKTNQHHIAAFRQGMAEMGWKEGLSFILEERWAEGRHERLQPLAEELASKQPAVIVAVPSTAAAAAAKAASKTPIVVAGGDPLASGLVSNLARPGGMITGVTNIVTQINEKHLELLLYMAPKARRIGFLVDSKDASTALMEAARRSVSQHSVEGRFAEASSAEEIEPAMARLAKEGVHALVVMAAPLFVTERHRIVMLAATQRWPSIAGQREHVEAGGLLSYGADRTALSRRAAWYVDRILKGAKPGDLPVEQPTTFELVVNMRTAKALGITVPQSILVRADKVIE